MINHVIKSFFFSLVIMIRKFEQVFTSLQKALRQHAKDFSIVDLPGPCILEGMVRAVTLRTRGGDRMESENKKIETMDFIVSTHCLPLIFLVHRV
jgi:hypothetical protein